MKKQIRAATTFFGLAGMIMFFQSCNFASPSGATGDATFSKSSTIDIAPANTVSLPSTGGSGGTGTTTAPAPSSGKVSVSVPVAADRHLIAAIMTDVFGPTYASVDSTNLAGDSTNNGAPCSLYEDYYSAPSTTANPTEVCSSGSQSLLTAMAIPNISVTRVANITHACSDLTTNATTFAYALAKVGTGVPAVNASNLQTLVQLFYRDQGDPTPALISSLQSSFPNPASPTSDDWRVAMYSICASNYWQVL